MHRAALLALLLPALLASVAAAQSLKTCGTLAFIGPELFTLDVASGATGLHLLPFEYSTWFYAPARDQILVFGAKSAIFINVSTGAKTEYNEWTSPTSFEGDSWTLSYVGYDARKGVIYTYRTAASDLRV